MTSSTGPSTPPLSPYPAPPAPPAGWAPPAWAAPAGPVSFAGQDTAGGPRRRRGLRTALVAVPALLVVAGASAFITVLATGSGHATTAGSGSAAAAKAGASTKHATVGTLTSENGSTWVVRTAAGKTVKVDLGSKTAFGSKAHPSAASAFHTGSDVKIVGADKGSTLDAKRVVLVTGSGSTGAST